MSGDAICSNVSPRLTLGLIAEPKVNVHTRRLLGFTEDMWRRGLTASSKVLSFRRCTPDAPLAQRLQLEDGEEAFEIVRLRLADRIPMAYENCHLPARLCPQLKRAEVERGSLYQLLEQNYGVRIARTDPTSILSRPTVSRTQLLRPFPQYTAVFYSRPLANMGDAEYHAMQLKLQKRFAKGLSLLTHYTWSKSMDIGGTGNGIAFTDPTPVQNIYNLRDEWSLSTADVPHRIVISGVYELPFGYKRRFGGGVPRAVDLLIGGWQLSGSYTWQRGTPLAVTAANRLAIGNAVMRASLLAGADPRIDIGKARDNVRANGFWFNPQAFINPNDPKGPTNPNGPDQVDSAKFVLGDASRTLDGVRRDNYINLDFALWKSFRIAERLKLEFRGEFFNAFNRLVFGTPVTNVNDSQFGRVTTQLNPPRRIQLAGRIVF